MVKTYEKILFDLDNTLVDDDENRKYAIKQILIEREEEKDDERIEEFIKLDNQFWKDRAEGKIKDPYIFKTKEEKTEWVRTQRFIKYFENISFKEGSNINEEYIKYLSENIVPIKNAQNIIKYLYEKKYEMYIITNGPAKAVRNKLEKIDVLKYITGIFTAEEAGNMKPRHEFFEKFFEKLDDYNRENMLIVGDELEKDVAGGNQNGIDSCWLNMKKTKNNTEYKPTYEIEDLIELKDFL